MDSTLRFHTEADRPAASLWLFDDDGSLVDLSSGYTFAFRIGSGSTATIEKTSGITGAAGAEPVRTGTPNVVITWTSGELADLDPGAQTWTLIATTGGLDRIWSGEFVALATMAAPAA